MWSDLGIKHLLALRAVAEEGTFGRAAERLGFTQSAVSQQVASLESMVGHELFNRGPGRTRPVLTPAGELLLAHAIELLDGVEEAERDMARFARGVSGRLVVGTYQSMAARVLPTALREVYADAPGVEVALVSDDIHQDFFETALLRGELDVAFAVDRVPPTLNSIDLGADPHIAIVPADHPDGPIRLESLSGSPMVGQPAEDSCGLIIDRQLERLGITPHYSFRSHDNGAVQGMVAAGMGVAIMPLLSADLNDARTSVRTTEPELEPRQLFLTWNKARPLSPLAKRFADAVESVCSTLLARADREVSPSTP